MGELMQIELAGLDKVQQLSEVAVAAGQELRGVDFSEQGWSRFVGSNTPQHFEAKINTPDFFIVCCVQCNCVMGFLSIKGNEKLDQLFVRPEVRKTGVAAALWRFARQYAIERGNLAGFWVRSSSLAIPVYEKFGFTCEGGRQNFEGISFQLMRLNAHRAPPLI